MTEVGEGTGISLSVHLSMSHQLPSHPLLSIRGTRHESWKEPLGQSPALYFCVAR